VIEICNKRVQETWTEYAVEAAPGCLVECDDLTEAQKIAGQFGTAVLQRRCYLTEWHER
jgi:hypothetical protein